MRARRGKTPSECLKFPSGGPGSLCQAWNMAKKRLRLTPEQRLLKNIERVPLATMHLLLREHGWRPNYSPEADWWEWTLVECDTKIRTGKWMRTFWDEVEPGFLAKHRSVALLRKRLKELAEAQRLKRFTGF
jgi:hypothetical protein